MHGNILSLFFEREKYQKKEKIFPPAFAAEWNVKSQFCRPFSLSFFLAGSVLRRNKRLTKPCHRLKHFLSAFQRHARANNDFWQIGFLRLAKGQISPFEEKKKISTIFNHFGKPIQACSSFPRSLLRKSSLPPFFAPRAKGEPRGRRRHWRRLVLVAALLLAPPLPPRVLDAE